MVSRWFAPGTLGKWSKLVSDKRSKWEFRTLATLLLIVALALIFGVVANEMREGETRAFDNAVLLAMRNPDNHADPIGPAWFENTVAAPDMPRRSASGSMSFGTTIRTE